MDETAETGAGAAARSKAATSPGSEAHGTDKDARTSANSGVQSHVGEAGAARSAILATHAPERWADVTTDVAVPQLRLPSASALHPRGIGDERLVRPPSINVPAATSASDLVRSLSNLAASPSSPSLLSPSGPSASRPSRPLSPRGSVSIPLPLSPRRVSTRSIAATLAADAAAAAAQSLSPTSESRRSSAAVSVTSSPGPAVPRTSLPRMSVIAREGSDFSRRSAVVADEDAARSMSRASSRLSVSSQQQQQHEDLSHFSGFTNESRASSTARLQQSSMQRQDSVSVGLSREASWRSDITSPLIRESSRRSDCSQPMLPRDASHHSDISSPMLVHDAARRSGTSIPSRPSPLSREASHASHRTQSMQRLPQRSSDDHHEADDDANVLTRNASRQSHVSSVGGMSRDASRRSRISSRPDSASVSRSSFPLHSSSASLHRISEPVRTMLLRPASPTADLTEDPDDQISDGSGFSGVPSSSSLASLIANVRQAAFPTRKSESSMVQQQHQWSSLPSIKKSGTESSLALTSTGTRCDEDAGVSAGTVVAVAAEPDVRQTVDDDDNDIIGDDNDDDDDDDDDDDARSEASFRTAASSTSSQESHSSTSLGSATLNSAFSSIPEQSSTTPRVDLSVTRSGKDTASVRVLFRGTSFQASGTAGVSSDTSDGSVSDARVVEIDATSNGGDDDDNETCDLDSIDLGDFDISELVRARELVTPKTSSGGDSRGHASGGGGRGRGSTSPSQSLSDGLTSHQSYDLGAFNLADEIMQHQKRSRPSLSLDPTTQQTQAVSVATSQLQVSQPGSAGACSATPVGGSGDAVAASPTDIPSKQQDDGAEARALPTASLRDSVTRLLPAIVATSPDSAPNDHGDGDGNDRSHADDLSHADDRDDRDDRRHSDGGDESSNKAIASAAKLTVPGRSGYVLSRAPSVAALAEADAPLASPLVWQRPPHDDDEQCIFVPAPPASLLCPLHGGVLRQPMLGRCGHSYCHQCVLKRLASDPHCPLDGVPFESEHLFPNDGLLPLLNNLTVRCRYGTLLEPATGQLTFDPRGCPENVRFANRSQHEDTCLYAFTSCPYSRDCKQVRKRNLDHHRSVCTRVPCLHAEIGCAVTGSKAEIDAHVPGCAFGQFKQFIVSNNAMVESLQAQMMARDVVIARLSDTVMQLTQQVAVLQSTDPIDVLETELHRRVTEMYGGDSGAGLGALLTSSPSAAAAGHGARPGSGTGASAAVVQRTNAAAAGGVRRESIVDHLVRIAADGVAADAPAAGTGSERVAVPRRRAMTASEAQGLVGTWRTFIPLLDSTTHLTAGKQAGMTSVADITASVTSARVCHWPASCNVAVHVELRLGVTFTAMRSEAVSRLLLTLPHGAVGNVTVRHSVLIPDVTGLVQAMLTRRNRTPTREWRTMQRRFRDRAQHSLSTLAHHFRVTCPMLPLPLPLRVDAWCSSSSQVSVTLAMLPGYPASAPRESPLAHLAALEKLAGSSLAVPVQLVLDTTYETI